jgi:uncharacterized membrane protein YqaE (UPF0057 family)
MMQSRTTFAIILPEIGRLLRHGLSEMSLIANVSLDRQPPGKNRRRQVGM